MTNIDKILPKARVNQQAFILDHGKVEDGQLKYADDLTSYGWNTKRNNKLKVGAFVLNRHSGKLTEDKKFEIYAGGYVQSISEPDNEGNVTALITNAFTITPPIKQGEPFIENFKWTSKNKRPDNWLHFWNQYGMNQISYEEFLRLVKDKNCIPIDSELPTNEYDVIEDKIKQLQDENSNIDFTIILNEDGPSHKQNKGTKKFIARKIDFDHINKAKQQVGALGEEIILKLLTVQAEKENLKTPLHVSKEEGDGVGYDIRSWDKYGKEIHIEVKASTNKFIDGFEMSRNEVKASLTDAIYKIYHVYAINLETKQCKIKIYDGPFIDEKYEMVPNSFKIYNK